MKYLKKPDGSIEQFEDERLHAYNLDRQIYEQKGKDFGIIYDEESLPDNDKITLGLLSQQDYFLKINQLKIREIKQGFANEFIDGHFFSDALQIEVDYRRCQGADGDGKNDLQNVEKLINYMVRKNLPETIYKGYEAQKSPATVAKLKTLVEEMEYHGIELHAKKDSLLNQIEACTTIEQLNLIKW